MAASSDVWVLLDHHEGEPTAAGLRGVSAARALAARLDRRVTAVAVDPESAADDTWPAVGAAGADRVLVAHARPPVGRSPAALTDVVATVLAERAPAAVVAPGTDLWSDVATRVSVRLDLPLVEDCVSWRVDTDALRAYQPGPENRYAVRLRVEDPPVLVVPTGTFAAQQVHGPPTEIEVVHVDRPPIPTDPILRSVAPEDKRGLPLEHADVVVAGGRGLGTAEGFELLQRLARALDGTVGASRMATDLGWITADRLVGQTGKTVRPRLYVACGISGASQHVAGMRESETIVAVNTDPHAPIAAVADVMALGEIDAVVPALIEALEGGQR